MDTADKKGTMKKLTGIRATKRTRKEYPSKLCALEGCGLMFEDKPTFHKNGAVRKYCSPSCSVASKRLVGEQILSGRPK